MVTVVVVEKSAQPPLLLIKYLMVYVPAAAPAGVMVPDDGSIDKPEGLTENVPPWLPVNVTGTGGLGEFASSAALHKTFLL